MKRVKMPRRLGAPKPDPITYTLVDTSNNKVLLSCSDRALVETFIANRVANGRDVSSLKIREESVKTFTSDMKNNEAMQTIHSAIAHSQR